MKIDFHTHIFPPEIRNNRERYFNAEPEFTLLYNSPKSRISGAMEILDVMDEQGIDFSVVFGFPWRNPDLYKMHNDYVMEAVKRFPDRLAGFGCFSLLDAGAAGQAHRLRLFAAGAGRRGGRAATISRRRCCRASLPHRRHTLLALPYFHNRPRAVCCRRILHRRIPPRTSSLCCATH